MLDLPDKFDRLVLRWTEKRKRCAICMRRCHPRDIVVHALGVHFHRRCFHGAGRDELENISRLMEAQTDA